MNVLSGSIWISFDFFMLWFLFIIPATLSLFYNWLQMEFPVWLGLQADWNYFVVSGPGYGSMDFSCRVRVGIRFDVKVRFDDVFRFGCCCKSTEIILSCKVWDKARLNFFVGLDLGFTLTVNIILRFVSSWISEKILMYDLMEFLFIGSGWLQIKFWSSGRVQHNIWTNSWSFSNYPK